MSMIFTCRECQKTIRTAQDEISFFDNHLCADCETLMFIQMEADGKRLRATSPDTVERFNAVTGNLCHKCGFRVSGRVVEVESGDLAIAYCEKHFQEFMDKYATSF